MRKRTTWNRHGRSTSLVELEKNTCRLISSRLCNLDFMLVNSHRRNNNIISAIHVPVIQVVTSSSVVRHGLPSAASLCVSQFARLTSLGCAICPPNGAVAQAAVKFDIGIGKEPAPNTIATALGAIGKRLSQGLVVFIPPVQPRVGIKRPRFVGLPALGAMIVGIFPGPNEECRHGINIAMTTSIFGGVRPVVHNIAGVGLDT